MVARFSVECFLSWAIKASNLALLASSSPIFAVRPAQEAVEIHYLNFKVRALRLEPSLFSHLFHFNAYARDAEMPKKQLRHIKAVRIRPPVKISSE
ncbi:hypothetical protein Vi05172_g12922 [Venturia inaequalis]|nr:hypothetical protein Vi05172_g12922 [Venturia inaequalis]